MAKLIKESNGINRRYRSANHAGKSEQTEKTLNPSLVVPDESMSVRTILDRYAKGTLNDVALSRQMDYTEDLPDLRGVDISQLHEMREYARAEVKNIESELKNRKKSEPIQEAEVVEPEKTQL